MTRRVAARVVAMVGLLLVAVPALAQEGPSVLVARVAGPITPVVADELADALAQAESGGAGMLLVELDTPGGLDTSMRQIVQSFLNSPLPVVVYVSPSGARAASAGAIVTQAAHVAAMAPGTTIGAATPVDPQGAEVTDKIINDAASYAIAIAQQRGRDAEFAEEMVRRGTSITDTEALERGVVDLVAASRTDLLEQLDGQVVEVNDTDVVLDTAGAVVEEHEIGFFRGLLSWLADPTLAFLFLSIGTLAILYELSTPGTGLGGAVGVVLLVLALFSLSVLPVNLAGAALVLLGIGLLVAELFVPGIGVLAVGGGIALVMGGIFLFEGSLGVSPWVLVPAAAVLAVAAIVAGRVGLRARRLPVVSGSESYLGRTLTIRSARGNRGWAHFEGAWWTVESRGAPLHVGTAARVVGVDGLNLVVEPEESSS